MTEKNTLGYPKTKITTDRESLAVYLVVKRLLIFFRFFIAIDFEIC